MALGSSAGRSRNNPTHDEAKRRATPMERAKVKPNMDDSEHVRVPAVERADPRHMLRLVIGIGTGVVVLAAFITPWLLIPGLALQIIGLMSYDARFISEPRLKSGRRIGH